MKVLCLIIEFYLRLLLKSYHIRVHLRLERCASIYLVRCVYFLTLSNGENCSTHATEWTRNGPEGSLNLVLPTSPRSCRSPSPTTDTSHLHKRSSLDVYRLHSAVCPFANRNIQVFQRNARSENTAFYYRPSVRLHFSHPLNVWGREYPLRMNRKLLHSSIVTPATITGTVVYIIQRSILSPLGRRSEGWLP